MEYWEEFVDEKGEIREFQRYSQFKTYYKGDIALYNDTPYICLVENGWKFENIRIPIVNGWKLAEYTDWNPIEYELWNVVKFDGSYYTLMSLEGSTIIKTLWNRKIGVLLPIMIPNTTNTNFHHMSTLYMMVKCIILK